MGKGSAPATPDYAGAAKETAAGNLESAKLAIQANRANQYTPWGNLEWTNDRSFDQAGYDAAMQAYNSGASGGHWERRRGPDTSPNEGMSQATFEKVWVPGGPGGSGAAPNRDDFFSGGDNWTQKVTLSPEMQALFDQQNRLQQGLFGAQDQALGRVNQVMGQGFDMSGMPQGGTALNMSSLPGMGTALDVNSLPGFGDIYDPTRSTNNAAELLMQRINPELDRQQESLRAQLANQGIAQGSKAWNDAMAQNQYGRNDAVTQAQLQGIGLGMQQQGLQFGQQTTNQQLAAALQNQQFGQQQGLRMGEAGLQNQQFAQSEQARQRAMSEAAYLRNLPMNELNALRTGNQVSMPQFPGYAQQATTGGPDMLGAAQGTYNAQLGAANAQNAGGAGMMGGLMGLGQLGMMGYGAGLFGGGGLAGIGTVPASLMAGIPSDRRLKRNIKRVGKADNGLNVYSYQYVWGGPTQIGHMADEVELVAPDAVFTMPSGYKAVNYGAL